MAALRSKLKFLETQTDTILSVFSDRLVLTIRKLNERTGVKPRYQSTHM